MKYGAAKGKFLKDAERFVMVPRNALKMHDVLLEKMKKALEISESSEYNSITRNGEVGLIRMVVNDAEVVVRQLESEGFMLAKSKKNVEVIAVLITEQHSLSEITRLLDDNEVNIDYAYSSSIHLNGKSGLILRVSDPDKSERILKENGIRTLTTTDLQ